MEKSGSLLLEPERQVESSEPESSGEVKKFEALVKYGQVKQIEQNPFFTSLDPFTQDIYRAKTWESLQRQSDQTTNELMRYQDTFAQGVRTNKISQMIEKVKLFFLDRAAKRLTMIAEIPESAEGKQRF